MSQQGHVLVVDDEPDIRDMVRRLLERAGHTVSEASDGKTCLDVVEEKRPDVILLDVGMPILDGWQTLERLRAFSEVPVMMLTARTGELDKVRGLKAGADDYVTKPFGRQELLARVEVLMRRGGQTVEPETVYEDSLIKVDFVQAAVSVQGESISLTPLEFKLLCAFVRRSGQLLSHRQLLELVWGTTIGSRDQVKLYVGYLRRKLGWEGDSSPIETVRGFGYRYSPTRQL